MDSTWFRVYAQQLSPLSDSVSLRLPYSVTVAFAGGNDQVFRSGFQDGEVAAAKSGLGTNLEVVEDFSAAYSFTNLFKQSRPWITAAPGGCPLDSDADSSSSCFDTNEAAQLDLDADGWVQ